MFGLGEGYWEWTVSPNPKLILKILSVFSGIIWQMKLPINWGIRLLCDKLAHIQTWQWFQLFLNSLLSAIALLSFVRWLSPLFKVIPGAYQMNSPLTSSKNPHSRNEARCITFVVKISFICMRMKNDFHTKGWAPTLVLKQMPGGTRKWPIWT